MKLSTKDEVLLPRSYMLSMITKLEDERMTV